MFIEVTLIKEKEKMMVNIRNIVSVFPYERRSVIRTPCYLFNIKESYDQVKELIKREVAAERGY